MYNALAQTLHSIVSISFFPTNPVIYVTVVAMNEE